MVELAQIQELRAINFKSFHEAELRLSPLTMLIGANASGKSNLVESIRLLRWLARGGRLDEVARALEYRELAVRGSLADLTWDGRPFFDLGCSVRGAGLGAWTEFDAQMLTRDSGIRVWYEAVKDLHRRSPLYSIEKAASAGGHDIAVAYNNFAKGGRKPQITCTDQQLVLTQLGTPARFGEAHQRSQKVIPKVTGAFRDALGAICFLDPVPAAMRGYANLADKTLAEDGRNLSSVLFHLCQRAEQKSDVLAFVRALPEQDIADISFVETPRNEAMVQLEESFAGQRLKRDAPVLSDGTLRVLAVAAALLSAREGSLIVIEEIDNGVHPSRAALLLEGILRIARARSLHVLLTSHNPALLDALPTEAVPKVACCYRDPEKGDSRIVHVEDLPSAPELLARGPLGGLMTNGVLDRYLKDTRKPEERSREAMAWLKEFQGAK